MTIRSISGKKVLASLGNETVEATVKFTDGSAGTASVPAGISAGKYEVPKSTPDQALGEISKLNVLCQGRDWTQETMDSEISKYEFGGNATLAVSAAFFKSQIGKQPKVGGKSPRLMVLMFEGGEHGNRANKTLTIQECMVLETEVGAAKAAFGKLREYLEQNEVETLVGAEGGFSPGNYDNYKALNTIKSVFPETQICLDAADCFQQGACPDYEQIIANYNIFSIEDPYSDEDWGKWSELVSKHGDRLLVVGDDLTTTSPTRIRTAITKGAINAVVIKPNQIGTITKAREAVKVAREGGLKVIVSHRGEETDDAWIVDFALDVQADYVKFGGIDRGERIAKYNRLMELGME